MTIWPLVIKVAYGGHNGNGGILGEEWKSPLDNLQPLALSQVGLVFDVIHLVWEFLRQEINIGIIPKCVVAVGCLGKLLNLFD